MSQICFIRKKKKSAGGKTTPWNPSLPWKTAFTGRVAGWSCFRPLVATSLLKAALRTALIPLCRGSWSWPRVATGLFSLTVYVFLLDQIVVLHLSIQPRHHSSMLDVTLEGQGDGGVLAWHWDIQKSSKSQLKMSENFVTLLHTQNMFGVKIKEDSNPPGLPQPHFLNLLLQVTLVSAETGLWEDP